MFVYLSQPGAPQRRKYLPIVNTLTGYVNLTNDRRRFVGTNHAINNLNMVQLHNYSRFHGLKWHTIPYAAFDIVAARADYREFIGAY